MDKYRKKRGASGFIKIPHFVCNSEEFCNLSVFALKLLIDLMSQYNGFNNGSLTICWQVMTKRGWKSKDTLYKAKDELLLGRWIAITRVGNRKKTSLYALTTYSVNEDLKKVYDFGVSSTDAPAHSWHNGLRGGSANFE